MRTNSIDESLLNLISSLGSEDLRRLLKRVLRPRNMKATDKWAWSGKARAEQMPRTDDDWIVWLLLAGRGFGKTRTGVETIRALIEHGGIRRVVLVGPTAADVRSVMVEGESGLLSVFPPWKPPVYEFANHRILWENGAIAGRIKDRPMARPPTSSRPSPGPMHGPFPPAAGRDRQARFFSTSPRSREMDPISLALSLARFVPAILRWLGGDQAGDVAQTVVSTAETLTGKTGADALDAIKADPAQQLAFQQAMNAQSEELEKAYLADRASARSRDLGLAQAGRRNIRADVLAYTAIGGLISLIWALLVRQIPEGSTQDILLILSSALVAIVKDVYGFEFGSSRGERGEDGAVGAVDGDTAP
jgi:hypothetical protein